MSDSHADDGDRHLPAAQRALRARSVHPSGTFHPFLMEAVETTIVARFEAMVGRDPAQLAVRTPRHALTYGALNAFANRIAHAIVREDPQGGEAVAMYLGHDAPAIAAMLGILKAGRLYVPLDPRYPRARLEYMLRDSGASLLLSEPEHLTAARHLAGGGVRVLDVLSLDEQADNPEPHADSRRAVFVLYTSGSTGHPKGIIQNHRNVLFDVRHYTNTSHFCPDDRFVLISSMSFADSVRTIYGSLLNGGTLFPFDVHREGIESLPARLLEERVTIYRSVPSVFRALAQTLTGGERFSDVRMIHLGGEAVRRTDVDVYRKHFPPPCVLLNRLGTTEVLTVRCQFIDHDTPITGSTVSVGYAVPGKELLLLDEAGHGVPPGEVGEMAVRSRYLSPGIWRQPELTRTLFVADPDDPELRTYRTGDLGRFGEDGSLEHLGRKDFQVKIRGHRIETAEVENAIVALGSVREAVVAAEQRAAGERLVAYVVPAVTPPPSAAQLRQQLAERLPSYMVPAHFVALDALPRLPNGKLDRRALPDPGRSRPALDTALVAPRSATEAMVADVWCEVLDLQRIGVHDPFLDLGGDSLAATRVAARISERVGQRLTVATLWDGITVARMASIVDAETCRIATSSE